MISIYSEASNKRLSEMFVWKGWESIEAPLLSSLIIMLILLILGAIIGIKAHRAYKRKDYLKRPKGLLFLVEIYYDMIENFVTDNMGHYAGDWGGFFWTLFAYLFMGFTFSLTGLPGVIDWLAAPLSLSIIMFVLIQATAIHYQKFGYFHRFIEPIIVFLPINLITMWAPIISTSMRMLGNALAGTIILGLIQWALSLLSGSIWNAMGVSGQIVADAANYWNAFPYWTGIWLAPVPMGVLNLYFGLFSGFVQTLVFSSLTSLWIAQERPEDEDFERSLKERALEKQSLEMGKTIN